MILDLLGFSETFISQLYPSGFRAKLLLNPAFTTAASECFLLAHISSKTKHLHPCPLFFSLVFKEYEL